jgi:hypothetical protein
MAQTLSVDHCIEQVCQKGCSSVWSDIEALEAGRAIPEAEGLDEGQRAVVLVELKSVMSVYEGTCSVS